MFIACEFICLLKKTLWQPRPLIKNYKTCLGKKRDANILEIKHEISCAVAMRTSGQLFATNIAARRCKTIHPPSALWRLRRWRGHPLKRPTGSSLHEVRMRRARQRIEGVKESAAVEQCNAFCLFVFQQKQQNVTITRNATLRRQEVYVPVLWYNGDHNASSLILMR